MERASFWVCPNCRSVNELPLARCYRCDSRPAERPRGHRCATAGPHPADARWARGSTSAAAGQTSRARSAGSNAPGGRLGRRTRHRALQAQQDRAALPDVAAMTEVTEAQPTGGGPPGRRHPCRSDRVIPSADRCRTPPRRRRRRPGPRSDLTTRPRRDSRACRVSAPSSGPHRRRRVRRPLRGAQPAERPRGRGHAARSPQLPPVPADALPGRDRGAVARRHRPAAALDPARQRNATVILGEAVGIDVDKREVQVSDGGPIAYDTLIVATGAHHTFFGHDDWAQARARASRPSRMRPRSGGASSSRSRPRNGKPIRNGGASG